LRKPPQKKLVRKITTIDELEFEETPIVETETPTVETTVEETTVSSAESSATEVETLEESISNVQPIYLDEEYATEERGLYYMADENGEKVLRDGTIINSYNIYDNDKFIDTVHNTYIEHAMCLLNESYTTYFLGGKYKTLSGTLAIADDSSSKGTVQITIYDSDTGDILYTTDTLDRVTKPIDVTVNVENIDFITIKQSNNCEYMCTILYNFKAE
jgi:hypothetical protein